MLSTHCSCARPDSRKCSSHCWNPHPSCDIPVTSPISQSEVGRLYLDGDRPRDGIWGPRTARVAWDVLHFCNFSIIRCHRKCSGADLDEVFADFSIFRPVLDSNGDKHRGSLLGDDVYRCHESACESSSGRYCGGVCWQHGWGRAIACVHLSVRGFAHYVVVFYSIAIVVLWNIAVLQPLLLLGETRISMEGMPLVIPFAPGCRPGARRIERRYVVTFRRMSQDVENDGLTWESGATLKRNIELRQKWAIYESDGADSGDGKVMDYGISGAVFAFHTMRRVGGQGNNDSFYAHVYNTNR